MPDEPLFPPRPPVESEQGPTPSHPSVFGPPDGPPPLVPPGPPPSPPSFWPPAQPPSWPPVQPPVAPPVQPPVGPPPGWASSTWPAAGWPAPPPSSDPASSSRPAALRRGLWAGVGAIAATALIAAGFGIAQVVDDDEASTAAVTPSVSVAPENAAGGTTGSVEPATAAAAKVGPSVVLLTMRGSSGSGIVFDKGGLIVTNAHVVQAATNDRVNVQFANGRRTEGTVVGRDSARDIALVRVGAADDLVPATFAKTADVRVGQTVIAVGSPFGLDQTVTEGIVSAIGRQVRSFGNCLIDMVQTDAPINPGNSGGALADRLGQVIGMNTSIRTDGEVSQNAGVGFAVPSDTILATVDRMLKGESLEVAFMGVGAASSAITADGVLVGTVSTSSPAENAGLRSGDLITAVNGQAVRVWSEVRTRIQSARVGDVMELTVTRDGSSQNLRVTLGSSPNCRS
jgi:putative serine protease PepD